MQLTSHSRVIYFISLIVVVSILGFGFYLEYARGYLVCPLCLLQRIFFGLIGFTLLLALLFNPGKIAARIYRVCLFVFSGLGVAAAARQLWVQAQPAATATDVCVPGATSIFTGLNLTRAGHYFVSNAGQCADVAWRFLGVSIPGWALLFFCGYVLVSFVPIGQYKKGA